MDEERGTPDPDAPPCAADTSPLGRAWVRVRAPEGQVRFNLPLSGASSTVTAITPESPSAGDLPFTQTLYMMRGEVSARDYKRCVDAGVCADRSSGVETPTLCTLQHLAQSGALGDLPANCVRWEDAQVYCEWLGGDAVDARLPSEVEWEVAASEVGTLYPVPWDMTRPNDFLGDDKLYAYCPYANYGACKPHNPGGRDLRPTCYEYSPALDVTDISRGDKFFCDMSGNVAEWVLDDYETDVARVVMAWPQPFLGGGAGDPYRCDEASRTKAIRGGNYKVNASISNNAHLQTLFRDLSFYNRRESRACTTVAPDVGFRCVMEPR